MINPEYTSAINNLDKLCSKRLKTNCNTIEAERDRLIMWIINRMEFAAINSRYPQTCIILKLKEIPCCSNKTVLSEYGNPNFEFISNDIDKELFYKIMQEVVNFFNSIKDSNNKYSASFFFESHMACITICLAIQFEFE